MVVVDISLFYHRRVFFNCSFFMDLFNMLVLLICLQRGNYQPTDYKFSANCARRSPCFFVLVTPLAVTARLRLLPLR